jgi:hypothetical protein
MSSAVEDEPPPKRPRTIKLVVEKQFTIKPEHAAISGTIRTFLAEQQDDNEDASIPIKGVLTALPCNPACLL